jgi:hypothetical protein
MTQVGSFSSSSSIASTTGPDGIKYSKDDKGVINWDDGKGGKGHWDNEYSFNEDHKKSGLTPPSLPQVQSSSTSN